MLIACPQCKAQYKVDENRIPQQGVSINCPKCKHKFVVQRDATQSGINPFLSVADMPIVAPAVADPAASFSEKTAPIPLPGVGAPPAPASMLGAIPLPGMGMQPATSSATGAIPLPGMGMQPATSSATGAIPLPGMGMQPATSSATGAIPLPGALQPAALPTPPPPAPAPQIAKPAPTPQIVTPAPAPRITPPPMPAAATTPPPAPTPPPASTLLAFAASTVTPPPPNSMPTAMPPPFPSAPSSLPPGAVLMGGPPSGLPPGAIPTPFSPAAAPPPPAMSVPAMPVVDPFASARSEAESTPSWTGDSATNFGSSTVSVSLAMDLDDDDPFSSGNEATATSASDMDMDALFGAMRATRKKDAVAEASELAQAAIKEGSSIFGDNYQAGQQQLLASTQPAPTSSAFGGGLSGFGGANPSLSDIFGDAGAGDSFPGFGDNTATSNNGGFGNFGGFGGGEAAANEFAGSAAPPKPQTLNDGFLDFIEEASKAAGPKKDAQYRIRKRGGKVSGPFDEKSVVSMIKKSELNGSEEASIDGIVWKPLGQFPAFTEVLQQALASALAMLDDGALPKSKNSTASVPPVAGQTSSNINTDTNTQAAAGDARSEKLRRFAAPIAGISLGAFLLAAVGMHFTTEGGLPALLSGEGKAIAVVNPDDPNAVKPVKSDPLPKLTMSINDVWREDTFGTYKKIVDESKTILEKGKDRTASSDVSNTQQIQMVVSAYLSVVEKEAPVGIELKAVGDDKNKAIITAAIAYNQGKWDDGLNALKPLLAALPADSKSKPPESSALFLWRGLGLLGKNDNVGASAAFDEALQGNPNFVPALYQQAALSATTGQGEAAREYARKIIDISPKHPRSAVLLGRLLAADVDTRADADKLLREVSEGETSKAASTAQKADAWLARAEFALGERQFSEAMKFMNRAVELRPDDRALKLNYAQLALKLREFSVARTAYEQLLQKTPNDPEAIIGVARTKLAAKDLFGGYTDLQKALKAQPQNALISYWFGVAALEYKPEEAQSAFEKAQLLDEKRAAPAAQLIKLLADKNKLGDALAAADQASAKVDPAERYLIRTSKAEVYMRQRNYDLAEKELTLAVSEAPRAVEPRVLLIDLLIKTTKLDDAAKQVQSTLALDPKNSTVITAYGNIMAARGNQREALAQFIEAMSISPNDAAIYVQAAQAAATLNDGVKAKTYIDTAVQLQPNNADLLRVRVQLVRKNDPRQALVFVKQAQDTHPNDAGLWHELGTTYAQLGSFPEAIDAFQKAVRANSELVESYIGLGQAYREMGNNTQAQKNFNEAIKRSGKSVEARLSLAEVLLAQNRADEALPLYDGALTASSNSADVLCRIGIGIADSTTESSAALRKGANSLEQCTKQQENHPAAWRALGEIYRRLGRNREAVASLRTHLNKHPNTADTSYVKELIADLGG